MTKLTERQLDDLARLGTERVRAAVQSVDQLIDDPEQSSLFQHMMIGALVVDAAGFLSEHLKLDGEPMSESVAFYRVLATLARSGDVAALKAFMKEDW